MKSCHFRVGGAVVERGRVVWFERIRLFFFLDLLLINFLKINK